MGRVSQLNAPAERATAITPDNDDDLGFLTRFIFVGGAGNLKLDTVGGDTITLIGVTTGSVYPIRAKKVYATGTTATNLVGLY